MPSLFARVAFRSAIRWRHAILQMMSGTSRLSFKLFMGVSKLPGGVMLPVCGSQRRNERKTLAEKSNSTVCMHQRHVYHIPSVCFRYKVRYTDYGNEETLSWKRIRRMCSPDVTTAKADGALATPIPQTVPQQVKIKPTESDKISESFAGMRPRSIRSEKEEKKVPEQDTTPEQPGDVNVVNSTILSKVPGRKLSWREKLKTRKVTTHEGHESSTDVNPPLKQISLVPDFSAQKREREANNMLDKSNWRAKVVFGIGEKKDR